MYASRLRSILLRPSWKMDLGGWMLRGGVGGFFVLMGAEKFMTTGPGAEWIKLFGQIGIGQWFRYFTGVVEIAGGILFILPPTCAIGALLLSSAMVGAIVVHIVVRHSVGGSLYPLILLVAIVLAALRKPETEPPYRMASGRPRLR